MKVNSRKTGNMVEFDHYKVIQKGENYFAVIRAGEEITSGTSMGNACKKARLLEIGYQHGKEVYCEW